MLGETRHKDSSPGYTGLTQTVHLDSLPIAPGPHGTRAPARSLPHHSAPMFPHMGLGSYPGIHLTGLSLVLGLLSNVRPTLLDRASELSHVARPCLSSHCSCASHATAKAMPTPFLNINTQFLSSYVVLEFVDSTSINNGWKKNFC